MQACCSVLPPSGCASNHFKKTIQAGKKTRNLKNKKYINKMDENEQYHIPNPRSTRKSLFSSGVPGGPSKKFSGFTSP
jgi:hypothetical protein